MKQQVLYIHGGEAYSDYQQYLTHLRTVPVDPHPVERTPLWNAKLEESLGDTFEVFRPTMPNKHCAHYEEWKIWFERYFEFLRDDVILIGWSQGGMFLLRYLSEHTPPFSIKKLFLLATPFKRAVYGNEDGGDFYAQVEQLPRVGERAVQVFVLHSKDDFVVPFSQGEELVSVIPGSELVSFEDKNHFLVEDFPELITLIKQ